MKYYPIAENTLELRQICQRPDCPQRSVSIYITRIVLKFRVMSPTQVTILDFFIGLAGVLVYFVGTDWAFVLGGVLLQLFQVLDCVDGEVARYLISKGELNRDRAEQAVVEFIQDIVHPILQPLMFLAFSYGLFVTFKQDWILILGYIAAVGSSVDTYVNIVREKLLESADLEKASRIYKEMADRAGSLVKKIPGGLYLLKFIIFIVPIPGVMVVLLIVSILDWLIFPGSNFLLVFGLAINFKILALAIYAVIEQVLWFLNARGSIKSLRQIS